MRDRTLSKVVKFIEAFILTTQNLIDENSYGNLRILKINYEEKEKFHKRIYTHDPTHSLTTASLYSGSNKPVRANGK